MGAWVDAAMKPREWTATLTITIPITDDADTATLEDAERTAGLAKAIMDGIMVDVEVAARQITSGTIQDAFEDQDNIASEADVHCYRNGSRRKGR